MRGYPVHLKFKLTVVTLFMYCDLTASLRSVHRKVNFEECLLRSSQGIEVGTLRKSLVKMAVKLKILIPCKKRGNERDMQHAQG